MTQEHHDLLVEPSPDELARQNFVQGLKAHIATRVSPGVRELYEHRAGPRWEAAHGGQAPADRHQVRSALSSEPYYRLWSSLRRTSQHLLWASVADTVARQAPGLAQRAAAAPNPGPAGGSLRLDPDLEIPWYNAEVDIHCMPGGYRGEYGAHDLAAGALYDRGVYVYAMGQMGRLNDNYGQSLVANFLQAEQPGLAPRRILDLGCTVGHATLPYVDAYPGAEVHGIDLGAPVLRYAHARAEALGRAVHFSQQNAERTDFPDGHFDLIVSHIVLHEMSPAALRRMLAECHRLLASGGLMVHADFPGYAGVDPLTQAMIDWDTWNNHEPLWGPMRDMDLVAEAAAAGFGSDRVRSVTVPTTRLLQTGQQARAGQLWLLVGAR